MKIMFMINSALSAIAAGLFFFAMILAFDHAWAQVDVEHVIVGVVLGLAGVLS